MDTTTPPPVGPGVVSRRTLAAGAAWSVPVIMAASAAPAMAASGCSGPRYSTEQAGEWGADMVNVEVSDGTYASVQVNSFSSSPFELRAYGFGFTTAQIPSGSTIVSIRIEVRWYVTDDPADTGTGPQNGAYFRLQARDGATQIGDQFELTYDGSNWPIGAADAITTNYLLTGPMPLDTVVRSTAFGAWIGFGRESSENDYIANCDFIRITVCYR